MPASGRKSHMLGSAGSSSLLANVAASLLKPVAMLDDGLGPATTVASAAAAAAAAGRSGGSSFAAPSGSFPVVDPGPDDDSCCARCVPCLAWRRSHSLPHSITHSRLHSRMHSLVSAAPSGAPSGRSRGFSTSISFAAAGAAASVVVALRRRVGSRVAPAPSGILGGGGDGRPPRSDVVCKAISLRGLRRLKAHLQGTLGDAFGGLPTQRLVREWVVPATAGRRCRLAEVPELVSPGDLGPPHYFVSHAWANSFGGLLAAVEGFLGNASEETRVWLDIVAVNQHEGSEQNATDASSFEDVVQSAEYGTLVVMEPRQACNPARRAWCVYEWAATLRRHGPDGLMMSLGPAERVGLAAGLDISRAECSVAADWKRIMAQVRAEHGSVEAFNERLKLMLVLQPLSYRDDMRRLLARCRGTPWDFSSVQTWLAQQPQGAAKGGGVIAPISVTFSPGAGGAAAPAGPAGAGGSSPAPRVLCVLAGAGEGKSTISAALCSSLLATSKGVTCLYHFVKYSDQRRLDPLHVVRSLAFQLAERLPKLRPLILRANLREIAETGDLGTAVQGLLLEPLRHLTALKPTHQVIIVLDALDEADPLPATTSSALGRASVGSSYPRSAAVLAAAARASASSASAYGGARQRRVGSTTAGSATAAAPIVPLGNTVFQLLVKHLQALPAPCVRFVVTTRPGGLGGNIGAALQRAFSSGGASGGGGSGSGGGVRFLTPAQLRPTRAPTSSGFLLPSAAAGDAPGASSGVLVYLTVVRECGLAPPPPSRGGGGPCRTASGLPSGMVPQMTDLHWAYSQVFARGVRALTEVKAVRPAAAEAGPARALPLGSGGEGGDGEQGVAMVVEGAAAVEAEQEVLEGRLQRMQELLAVLLAAQEPLPMSLLQCMGLLEALPQLPGYGVMFYVDEHRVHTLHRSLADWLTGAAGGGSGAAAGGGVDVDSDYDRRPPFQVDPIEGHRLLARHLYDSVMIAGHGGGGGAADTTGTSTITVGASSGSGGGGGGGSSNMGNLPAYTLKYTVRHLVCAGEAARLGRLLRCFDFVAAVFGQGHGHMLISDALRLRVEDDFDDFDFDDLDNNDGYDLDDGCVGDGVGVERTCADDGSGGGRTSGSGEVRRGGGRVLADLQRGYLSQQHKLASGGGAKTGGAGVAACLMACPARTHVYQLARRYLLAMPPPAVGGRLRDVLGGSSSWSPLRMTLEGHGRSVTSVTWSHDGKTLASGSVDNSVRLWDVASGQCIGSLKGHVWPVTSVAWSPDGRTIASGSIDNSLRLWDVASGLCTATLEGHGGSVTSVCWCPDGKALASGSNDRTVRLWDVASGKCTCTLEGHVRPVTSVAWSPDGKTLASGSDDKSLRLWDVASGLWARKLKGHRRSVKKLYCNPEGKPLGNTTSYDDTLRLWASGQCTATLEGHVRPVTSVAWSPDGKTLASGSIDNSIRLWDATSAKCSATLEGRGGPVTSVSWSPNGRSLANGSYDGTLRLWEVASGRCTGTLEGHGGAVVCVAWSPNGKTVASGSDDSTLRLWDDAGGGGKTTTGYMHEGHMRPVTVTCESWNADGKTLANGSYDGTIRLWDMANGQCVGTLQGHEEAVVAMAWSPDGRALASGSDDSMIRLWDVASGLCVATLEGHEGTVSSVAWSPDGKRLATGGDDTTLRLWDVAGKECIAVLQEHVMSVVAVAWSPDGRTLASGSDDNSLRLWDVASGKRTTLLEGHGGAVSTIAWSPDGRTLASGSDDTTLQLWDVASGKCTATLKGHTRPATSLDWRPDGTILASGSVDNTVRLWDAARGGQCTGVLEGNGGAVTSVFWIGDGGTLASGGDDMMLRLWDVARS